MSKKTRRNYKAAEESSANTFKFFGVNISGIEKSALIWNLMFLIAISIMTKAIIIALYDQVAFVDFFDIGFYSKYVSAIGAGQIPYIGFQVDYPQFFFIPIILSMLLSSVVGSFPLAFIIIAFAADALLVVFVYLASWKLNGEDHGKAFGSSLLYVTAFGSAYFVFTKYDVFPALFMMISLVLFIYGREIAGYVSGMVAFLMKWFPAVSLPMYVIYDKKNGTDCSKGLIYSALILLVFTVPFAIGNFDSFVYTYAMNAGWPTALAHGFIYLLVYVTHLNIISDMATVLMGLAVVSVAYWYYKRENKDYVTMTIAIVAALFFFILLNRAASPQHWLWIMPFFAIFLVDKIYEVVAFYAFNLCMALDFPFFYNRFYDNITGYYGNWTAVFFAIKFAIAFSILYIILRKIPKVESQG